LMIKNPEHMKNCFIYIILALGFISCINTRADENNPADDNNGTARIEFSQLSHDFGEISEGEKVACVFTFKNTGDADLLISSATTSCGCTVPEFDNEPVARGEKGTVEVVFDSSYRNGKQNKTITIRSNAERPVVILKINAIVITKN